MKTIIENGRIKYQCEKCYISGSDSSVIEAGYCHKRTSGSHFGNKTSDKKLEQKHRVKGMSNISIKKFDSYFE